MGQFSEYNLLKCLKTFGSFIEAVEKGQEKRVGNCFSTNEFLEFLFCSYFFDIFFFNEHEPHDVDHVLNAFGLMIFCFFFLASLLFS